MQSNTYDRHRLCGSQYSPKRHLKWDTFAYICTKIFKRINCHITLFCGLVFFLAVILSGNMYTFLFSKVGLCHGRNGTSSELKWHFFLLVPKWKASRGTHSSTKIFAYGSQQNNKYVWLWKCAVKLLNLWIIVFTYPVSLSDEQSILISFHLCNWNCKRRVILTLKTTCKQVAMWWRGCSNGNHSDVIGSWLHHMVIILCTSKIILVWFKRLSVMSVNALRFYDVEFNEGTTIII